MDKILFIFFIHMPFFAQSMSLAEQEKALARRLDRQTKAYETKKNYYKLYKRLLIESITELRNKSRAERKQMGTFNLYKKISRFNNTEKYLKVLWADIVRLEKENPQISVQLMEIRMRLHNECSVEPIDTPPQHDAKDLQSGYSLYHYLPALPSSLYDLLPVNYIPNIPNVLGTLRNDNPTTTE